MKHNKGFTLIELLVVIAIIGILSTVVLASLNSARAKGRDAKRIQEIGQIHTAIELYINEHGVAPNLGDEACSVPSANPNLNCIAYDTEFDPKISTLDSKPSIFARLLGTVVAVAQKNKGDAKGEQEISGPSWNKLGQQLKPYIASLAIDSKGREYGYVYEAPGALETGNNSSYRIYAKKMETKDGVFGYGIGIQTPDSGDDKGDDKGDQQFEGNGDDKGGDLKGGDKDEGYWKALQESCDRGSKEACGELRAAGY